MAGRKKNELTTKNSDVLAVSFLEQSGKDVLKPFSRDIFLMHTMINGAMHVKNIYKYAGETNVGDPVKLILEPKNKFDDKAILVKDKKNRKLGYIPRAKNEVLYHLLDAGKMLWGTVNGGDVGDRLDPEDSWIEIYIDVYMKD